MSAALRLVADRSELPPPAGEDVVASWVEFMTACGFSPSTIKIRKQSLVTLMGSAGVTDPLQLSRQHVIMWLARPTKQWTRVTYYRSVRAWCNWRRDFGDDPDYDLLKGIPKPKVPDAVPRPINDATIERLLAAKLHPRAHAYVRLALYQALRVHEIAKLRGEDFDFTAGWLSIQGKGNITRPIPIHPEIAKLADTMPEVGWWFPRPSDPTEHVLSDGVSNTITAALQMVGAKATAHQLRDTAATRLQRHFKDIRVTQSMLRHRDLKSTMKYTEASNDDMQQAIGGLTWALPASAPALALDRLSAEQQQALVALLQVLGGGAS